MLPVVFAVSLYSGLAVSVLVLHALFIIWVVFGAFLAWSRPVLRWLHIASLAWGILTEVLYWPCPLTFAENALEQRAGIEPYQGGFLLHYLDKLIYPPVGTEQIGWQKRFSRIAWIVGRMRIVVWRRQRRRCLAAYGSVAV